MKGLQETKDRTWYSVEALARYGDVLSMVGRGAEGQKSIDEALKLAAQVKVAPITNAEVLNASATATSTEATIPLPVSSTSGRYRPRARRLPTRVCAPNLGSPGRILEQGRAQAAVSALKKS